MLDEELDPNEDEDEATFDIADDDGIDLGDDNELDFKEDDGELALSSLGARGLDE